MDREGNEPIHVPGKKGSANGKFWILVDEYDIKPASTRPMSPSALGSLKIQGAFGLFERGTPHRMGVNHRGSDIRMPHQFLDGPDIIMRLQ